MLHLTLLFSARCCHLRCSMLLSLWGTAVSWQNKPALLLGAQHRGGHLTHERRMYESAQDHSGQVHADREDGCRAATYITHI